MNYRNFLYALCFFLFVWYNCQAQKQTNAGENRIVCSAQTVLEAQEPENGKGYWQIIKGYAVIQNPEMHNTPVDSLRYGKNVFRWTVVENGQTYYDDVSIFNHSFEITIYDKEFCQNVINLSTIDATIWQIDKQDTMLVENTDSVYLRPNENIFLWEISENGCKAKDVSIITNKSFEVDLGNDIITCASEIELPAKESDEQRLGQWSIVEGEVDIKDIYQPNSRIVCKSPRIVLRWTVWQNNCSATDDITIYHFPNGNCSDSLQVIDNPMESLSIYPNPSGGLFDLHYFVEEENQNLAVKVFDLNNHLIYSELFTDVSQVLHTTLDLSEFPKGIYTVKIIGNRQVAGRKVVIE